MWALWEEIANGDRIGGGDGGRQISHRHIPIWGHTLRCSNVDTSHTTAIMRPTGGVIAAVATAVVATNCAHAFVPPARASSWRTGAASQHQPPQDTCSAIDNRRFRRATAATTMALPVSAAPAQVEAAAEDPEDAELSCSGIGEQEEERPQQKRRWAAGVRRSLLRGAASLATFSVGATALSGMSADLQHRLNAGGDGATVVSMPGAMKSAEASVFKPFEKRTVEEKLANLPAFMVTNARGSPYLSPTEAHEPQVRQDVRLRRGERNRGRGLRHKKRGVH